MESPDPKLDARLRAVPLPEGLIQRLRQVALADDDGLDAALTELPLPAGLLGRLRGIPLAADEDLDQTLRDVAVPAGLAQRLRSIPWADDDGLDAALRDVPVPAGLAAPWQRRLQRQKRLGRLIQVMAAASMLLVVAGLYFGHQNSTGPQAKPGASLTWNSLPPQPVEDNLPAEEKLTHSIASPDPLQAAPSWRPDSPRIALAPGDREAAGGNPGHAGGLSVPSSVDLLADLDRLDGDRLSGHEPEQSPDPARIVERLVGRGMSWLPDSYYPFLIKNRTHPFVSPAADPRVQSTVVPLGVDGASYELTRRYLEQKELPPPEAVRTEDFLAAAVDYGFPQPTGQALGLSLAAGPSPFGGEGLCLLQVGVQAKHLPQQPHPPLRLVLAVDTSANMVWGGRMDMVRRALTDLGGHLDRGDRLSLIAFGQEARLLIDDVGPGEADQFAAAVRSLSARGSSNLAEGLGRACDLARQEAAPATAVRVVLLTDSMVELADDSAARLSQQVAEAAARGIALHVVDLSRQKESDPQLRTFAEAGRGAVHAAANADEVRWALREVVSGQSQIVARDALLRVSFNPQAVLEYRLLGHEATLLAGLLPGHPRADFHDGQQATALYEVRLAPGAGGAVATAELSWYDGDQPRPEGQRRLQQQIDTPQFAATFGQAAPALQEAALVAQVAEVLRKSPFVRTPRTALALARVWELAGQVDSRLYQRPSFVDFVVLVEQARKAKPAPPQERARRRSMR
jgi:Ca-activated chloride channel family protein